MSAGREDCTAHGDPSTAATIRLKLTAEQAGQIAPLATLAAACRQNVLFVALAAPFWDGDGLPGNCKRPLSRPKSATKFKSSF
jgi:hypothetical protein